MVLLYMWKLSYIYSFHKHGNVLMNMVYVHVSIITNMVHIHSRYALDRSILEGITSNEGSTKGPALAPPSVTNSPTHQVFLYSCTTFSPSLSPHPSPPLLNIASLPYQHIVCPYADMYQICVRPTSNLYGSNTRNF